MHETFGPRYKEGAVGKAFVPTLVYAAQALDCVLVAPGMAALMMARDDSDAIAGPFVASGSYTTCGKYQQQ